MSGFVYVGYNKEFQRNVYKIGCTKRSVEQRLKEMSANVPYEIQEYYKEKFDNVQSAERLIHEFLQNYRIKNELFRIPSRELSEINSAFKHARDVLDEESSDSEYFPSDVDDE
jgi:predicted transglutaminase-like protease